MHQGNHHARLRITGSDKRNQCFPSPLPKLVKYGSYAGHKCEFLSKSDARRLRHRSHILIAASGKIYQQEFIPGQRRCELCGICQRMTGFKSWYDTLIMAKAMEGSQSLSISYSYVFGPLAILEPCMLRTHAWVVQTGRNGVRLNDLSILILDQISSVAMQHTGSPRGQGRGMLAAFDPEPSRLHAYHGNARIYVGIKKSDCVGSAANARNE